MMPSSAGAFPGVACSAFLLAGLANLTHSWSITMTEANLTDFPSDIPEATTVLNLSNNRLTEVASFSFPVSSLTDLILCTNLISVVAPGVFTNCTNMEYLDLSYNHLYSLPHDTFQGLSSLKQLRIESNAIPLALQSDTFRGLHSLERLFTKNSTLESFPCLGPYTPNLMIYDGSRNSDQAEGNPGLNMTSITDECLVGLSSLTKLIIPFNPHMQFDSGIMYTFPVDFSYLDVTGCSLRSTELLHILADAVNVKYIEVASTGLTRFPVLGLIETQVAIRLGTNEIGFVGIGDLQRIRNAKILNFRRNNIRKFPDFSLNDSNPILPDTDTANISFPFLSELMLADNEIDEFPRIHAPLLGTLNLRRNVISHIEQSWLHPFTHLNVLDVAHNQLVEFGAGGLGQLLTSLDLSFNSLNYIEAAPDTVLAGVLSIRLRDNPIECDARVCWMKADRVVLDGVECSSPSQLARTSVADISASDLGCTAPVWRGNSYTVEAASPVTFDGSTCTAGSLASIHSKDENDGLVNSLRTASNTGNYWLGLKLGGGNRLAWQDDTPLIYSNLEIKSALWSLVLCENDTRTLSCAEETHVLRILAAHYGRTDTRTCPDPEGLPVSASCRSPSSYAEVAANCHGAYNCTLVANPSHYTDPGCTTGFPYLDIVYDCVEPVSADCPSGYTASTSGSCYKKHASDSCPSGGQLADIESKAELQFLVDNFADITGGDPVGTAGTSHASTSYWSTTGQLIPSWLVDTSGNGCLRLSSTGQTSWGTCTSYLCEYKRQPIETCVFLNMTSEKWQREVCDVELDGFICDEESAYSGTTMPNCTVHTATETYFLSCPTAYPVAVGCTCTCDEFVIIDDQCNCACDTNDTIEAVCCADTFAETELPGIDYEATINCVYEEVMEISGSCGTGKLTGCMAEGGSEAAEFVEGGTCTCTDCTSLHLWCCSVNFSPVTGFMAEVAAVTISTPPDWYSTSETTVISCKQLCLATPNCIAVAIVSAECWMTGDLNSLEEHATNTGYIRRDVYATSSYNDDYLQERSEYTRDLAAVATGNMTYIDCLTSCTYSTNYEPRKAYFSDDDATEESICYCGYATTSQDCCTLITIDVYGSSNVHNHLVLQQEGNLFYGSPYTNQSTCPAGMGMSSCSCSSGAPATMTSDECSCWENVTTNIFCTDAVIGVPYVCPPGTEMVDPVCTNCLAGKYNPDFGGTCLDCESGSVSKERSGSCLVCSQDSIPTTDLTDCEECPVGSYTNAPGETVCIWVDCSTPPEMNFTQPVSAMDTTFGHIAAYTCLEGYYMANGSGFLICDCAGNWTGDYINCTEIDECESNPCQNGATCNDYVLYYNCSCVHGYEGLHCETDIDECAVGPCNGNGECDEFVGNYTCTCHPGWTGYNCSEDILECASSPCSHGGTCNEYTNLYNCTCPPQWKNESNCAEDVDECVDFPGICNHGECVNSEGNYSCNCSPGYEGYNCSIDINECVSSPCMNGGNCDDRVNGYDCACPAGFVGVMCEIEVSDLGCKLEPVESEWEHRVTTADLLTPTRCQAYCRSLMFTHAAVTAGSECRCINREEESEFVNVGYCLSACTGDNTLECGGEANAMLVYGMDGAFLTTPDFTTVDCFLNPPGDSVVFVTNSFGLESCAKACMAFEKNYTFVGAESSDPCICSDTPPTGETSNTCGRQCPDDTTQICGDDSGDYYSVYSILPIRSVIDCGQPPVLPNADVSIDNTTLDSEATYTCDPGFTMATDLHIKICTDTETWAGNVSCRAVLPCEEEPCVHGDCTNVNAEQYDCSCHVGWEGVNCSRLVDCGQPPSFPNSFYDTPANTTYMSLVAYDCENGYYRNSSGTPLQQCTCNGTWVGDSIECEDVDECLDKPCVHASQCFNKAPAFMCVCEESFGGLICNVELPPETTEETPTNEEMVENLDGGEVEIIANVATQCAQAPDFEHTDREYDGVTVLTVLIYKCHTGYIFKPEMVNTRKIICNYQAEWQPRPKGCEVVMCPWFELPEGSLRRSEARHYDQWVEYICLPGRSYPDRTRVRSIICQADGTWSFMPPTCRPTPCPALVTNAAVILDTGATLPRRVDLACHAPRRLPCGIFRQTILCSIIGNWFPSLLDCNTDRCPPLPYIKNSMTDLHRTDAGMEVRVECKLGYRFPDGYTILYMQCMDDLIWNVTSPSQCNEIVCPPVPVIQTATPSTTTALVGTSITYTAEDKYWFAEFQSSTIVIECYMNETWAETPEMAEEIHCGDPGQVADAYRTMTTDTPGDLAIYECLGDKRFFQGRKTRSRNCTYIAVWEELDDECKGNRCPYPFEVPNADPDFVNATVGAVITYTCQYGYMFPDLSQHKEIQCIEKDNAYNTYVWDSILPAAIPIICPSLEGLARIELSTSDHIFDTVVNVTCESGWFFYDDTYLKTLRCNIYANWNESLPYSPCQRIRCPEVRDLPYLNFGSRDNVYESKINAFCYTGFEFPDQSWFKRLECLANEQWSELIDGCQVIECPPLPVWEERYASFNTTMRSAFTALNYSCADTYVFNDRVPYRESICSVAGTWDPLIQSCYSSVYIPFMPEPTDADNAVAIGVVAGIFIGCAVCGIVLLDLTTLFKDVSQLARCFKGKK